MKVMSEEERAARAAEACETASFLQNLNADLASEEEIADQLGQAHRILVDGNKNEDDLVRHAAVVKAKILVARGLIEIPDSCTDPACPTAFVLRMHRGRKELTEIRFRELSSGFSACTNVDCSCNPDYDTLHKRESHERLARDTALQNDIPDATKTRG